MDTRYFYFAKTRPQDAPGCTLVYGNQLDFAKWARKNGISKKNGADFYFDSTVPVDAKTNKDIPGFAADGTVTWNEALQILKKHFNI